MPVIKSKKHKNKSKKFYIGGAPDKVMSEWISENEIRINKIRVELMEKLSSMSFKYYCSVCLIIKDENEYLEEWLKWHISQGIEHFYIYDNGSKYPVSKFIADLGEYISSKVTVTDWSGTYKNAQPEAYSDCIRRFSNESRWIGFIDTDEHVRVVTKQTLGQFLKNYESYAGIMAMWIEYGACGQKHKSDLPLRKRFTKPSEFQSKLGKVFIQPLLMDSMYIHNGVAKEGFEVVDEHLEVMEDLKIGPDVEPTTDLICIDHYFTKSYEEWVEKMKRGRAHLNHGRKYAEFFLYNPDMEYCKENIALRQEYLVL